MEIRGKTISYASFKKKQRDQQENIIINKIEIIEHNLNTQNIEELNNLKKSLNDIRKTKMQGHLIRS